MHKTIQKQANILELHCISVPDLSSFFFFFLTNYRLERNLYVKLKDLMSNSIDPDETAHCEPSIWFCAVCKSLFLSPVAGKELKKYSGIVSPVLCKFKQSLT